MIRFVKMRNLTCLFLGLIILFSLLQACDGEKQTEDNDTSSADAIAFLHDEVRSGAAEIKASGLAITNSNNQRVIGFAIMVIDDHAKAEDKLKQIAAAKGVVEKDSIDVAHQQMINDLSKKSGAAFDKAYIQMMVTDHRQAIMLFNAAARNSDAATQSFADKTLPIIQMHLDSANAILTSLK
jgi:putative membrane protein